MRKDKWDALSASLRVQIENGLPRNIA